MILKPKGSRTKLTIFLQEELAQNHEFPIELESLPNTSRFNVRHMQKASRIIQSIRFPETCFNFPKFATKEEKESTYELLIGTLKCNYPVKI